jgi:streptomycin 3"-adenylyltransferase
VQKDAVAAVRAIPDLAEMSTLPEFSRTGATGWPTCVDPLRTWVLESCERLATTLGASHVGTYLHGSLASGSFHAPKSDVDLMFVVEGALEPGARRSFARAAAESNTSRPIVGSLECAVVQRATLGERIHPAPVEAGFREGDTAGILGDRVDWGRAEPDPDVAAHVQAICEYGIAIVGPPVTEVFRRFAERDVLEAVRGDREWILEGENLIGTPYYGILNVARSVWIAEAGSNRLAPSKLEAGLWLLDVVPPGLRRVVALALDVYRDASVVSEEHRRTGGRAWPRDELLAFRDWARGRRFR